MLYNSSSCRKRVCSAPKSPGEYVKAVGAGRGGKAKKAALADKRGCEDRMNYWGTDSSGEEGMGGSPTTTSEWSIIIFF